MIKDKTVLVNIYEMDISIVVFEANLMNNLGDRWIDTSATHHIYFDKEMCLSYAPINEGQ